MYEEIDELVRLIQVRFEPRLIHTYSLKANVRGGYLKVIKYKRDKLS